MTGQHDRQDERLTGQLPNQFGLCPLTGHYFEPWASGVLLVQEFRVSVIHVARFLHVGKTFAKKISRIYRYRNTVPPRLISHQGQMDGW